MVMAERPQGQETDVMVGMSCVFVFVIEENHILQVFSRDLTHVTTM